MKAEIEHSLTVAKELYKVMSEDEQFFSLGAKVAKKYLEAYLAEGFTREEAIQMVVALLGKNP